jgi:hypothetical protein
VFRPDARQKNWSWHRDGNRNATSARVRANAPWCVLPSWLFALTEKSTEAIVSVDFATAFDALLWVADRLKTLRDFLRLPAETLPTPPEGP